MNLKIVWRIAYFVIAVFFLLHAVGIIKVIDINAAFNMVLFLVGGEGNLDVNTGMEIHSTLDTRLYFVITLIGLAIFSIFLWISQDKEAALKGGQFIDNIWRSFYGFIKIAAISICAVLFSSLVIIYWQRLTIDSAIFTILFFFFLFLSIDFIFDWPGRLLQKLSSQKN